MTPHFQLEMTLGPADSIAIMNGGSRNKLACAVNESFWNQSMKLVPEAMSWANSVSFGGMNDCYVSQNTFGRTRRITDVRELSALFVDLDYYKTKYSDLEPFELWEVIKSELPWMPEPTNIVNSGRGMYLKWIFTQPLYVNRKTAKWDWPAQWQTYQDFLVRSLEPYGADSAAADISHVLRVPGTINSKSCVEAQGFSTGRKYDFEELKAIFNPVHISQRESKPSPKPRSKPRKYYRPLEKLFTWHSLAWGRMRDLEKLADLRGGRLTDRRRMAIFTYAVEACHYSRSEEQLKQEIQSFVQSCIMNPSKYDPYTSPYVNINEVIQRFREQEARGHFDWLDDPRANRYRLKTQTIIDRLEITATESRSMKTLVSKEQKYHRRIQKRREAGVREQSEYTSEVKKSAQERAEEARRFRSEGIPVSVIAETIGVSKRAVYGYLKV